MAVRVPLMETGRLRARVDEVRARKGPPPWSDALVLTDDIQAFIICHPPGQPNDTHYHLHDEWWVVLAGEIDWYIEDEPKPIRGRAGDFVFGPKNRWHHLEPVGTEPSAASPSTRGASSTATIAPAAGPCPRPRA